MTKTFGPDVSHWEGDIDWSQVPSDPDNPLDPQWFIFKATEGTGFVDGEFLENKAGAIQYGFPWAAYHFFLPNYDPIAQAEHFVNTVGDGCAVYVLDLERALLGLALEQLAINQGLDEVPDINDYFGLTEYPPELKQAMDAVLLTFDHPANTTSAITALPELVKYFLDRVEQLTNKVPVIYTSPGFWNTYMTPTPAWASDYPLWVAHWGVVEPTLPNGWTAYVIHQWGTSGVIPGIPGACDQNWFLGDLDDVWAFFEFEVEPPPIDIRVRVKVGLRQPAPILSAPKASANLIGYALPGKGWWSKPKQTGEDQYSYYRIGTEAYLISSMCEEITP